MKNLVSPICLTLLVGTLSIGIPFSLQAAETNSSPAGLVPGAEPSSSVAPPKLPYGVEDVLKLSRAQVGDEIVVKYVQNSGTIYNLGPQDIVYLRDQGVSDRVLTAMLEQRKVVTEATAQSSPPATASIPNAPTVPNAPMAPVAPDYAQVAPQASSPPPESSVYVIPSGTAAYPYYYSYPYYGYYAPYYYPGYWGPSISFGFGFGGYGYHHGGYYHGGYYHGGYGHDGYGHGGGGHGGYRR